ncbi:MAG TPA: rhomboid family intramembrane serine protease, partial [Kiritimatiellia bacterium]|nr:rhomboid family intramembrane serine protease [Kiritimatiellia bacterium]
MSYRPYYAQPNRNSFTGVLAHLPPVTGWLIKINLGVFLLFNILQLRNHPLYSLLPLSMAGLRQGMFWQPLTYIFLHGGFLHLLFNMFTLYFLGPETERTMGSKHFLAMYLLSGILGGL